MTDYYDRMMLPFGISISQFSILVNLEALSGCGVGELARWLQLEKSTLARTLKPLVKAGYVENCAPQNVRPSRLRLTGAGEDILAAAKPAWLEAQRVIQEKLSQGKCKMDARKLMEVLAELA
ncbi:MAG: MarR family winged helix-turn-helix transcriptional regulator [Deltaproteobacteria bacterium]|nr:MarR family winged helix-turn-helix transcriptional regulator [Deltaproteobacteria bacterium]